MTYPVNFESKIGFSEIRHQLADLCLCDIGRERVDDMAPSTLGNFVRLLQAQVGEMMLALRGEAEFPSADYFDLREPIRRIHPVGSYLEVHEMWNLKRVLETVDAITSFLLSTEDDSYLYPTLSRLTQSIPTFADLTKRIDRIIDKTGAVKDSASPELAEIRAELAHTENGIGRILQNILRKAQESGLVDSGAQPTIRDGRLVIPVSPAMKRKIHGIVHDESATGKTVFIEPGEVVEANNRIHELQAEERREIIRILQSVSDELRPQEQTLMSAFGFLGTIDFIRAKALLAIRHEAIAVQPADTPVIDWAQARHPLLDASLKRHGKKAVPLDITLTAEKHILVISGPNAGGKSVCIKTVGLLQYMLQCGLAVPLAESSRTGIFRHIMIDIGDEQSIEDELSTYSSHLLNMKNMMRQADNRSLLLIDEFGGGTEPMIGGAMAEAILDRFTFRHAFALITTHYHNLKQYADSHPGVVNGAMLYDRQQMSPLFVLSIGQPGSSFAIEIARKIGIPQEVIDAASAIVGQDYINSDKYLQDIIRDKNYWERKRQKVHEQENRLQEENARLQREIEELRQQRKTIINRAQEEAKSLISESNARIEAAIKDIRESQAERERTKDARQELTQFAETITNTHDDELIERKMRQIEARQQRKQQKRQQANEKSATTSQSKTIQPTPEYQPSVGDFVRVKGQTVTGRVNKLEGRRALVLFGSVQSRVEIRDLERAERPVIDETVNIAVVNSSTRMTIDERKASFHPDLDIRGMRGDEAIRMVQSFIDDAAMLSVARVRILHGTGNGILRTLVRQYLSKLNIVSDYHDEHVQFGGVGITVVDL